jgi:hypothetical protein
MFKEKVRRPHSHSIQQTGEEDHSPSVCYAGAGGLAHTRVSFALKASGSEAMCTPAGRCARLAPPRGVLSVAERGAKRSAAHMCQRRLLALASPTESSCLRSAKPTLGVCILGARDGLFHCHGAQVDRAAARRREEAPRSPRRGNRVHRPHLDHVRPIPHASPTERPQDATSFHQRLVRFPPFQGASPLASSYRRGWVRVSADS